MTSESASRLGIMSSEGISGVAASVPSASGTRSTRPSLAAPQDIEIARGSHGRVRGDGGG
jgi:hypothetical protein